MAAGTAQKQKTNTWRGQRFREALNRTKSKTGNDPQITFSSLNARPCAIRSYPKAEQSTVR